MRRHQIHERAQSCNELGEGGGDEREEGERCAEVR